MTDPDFIKGGDGFPKKTLDIIAVGTGKGRSMLPSLYDRQNSVKCWCQTCCKNETGEHHLFRMVVCPDCGNKRCPKATNHMLECSGSNEPGQEGSIY
jgi:Zn finger protein HypA/HybF involved in hydrogenase expression